MVGEDLRPGLFSLSPKWVKFDRYEVIQGPKGDRFIIPCCGSKMEYYRPLEHYPEILRDFINMASNIEDGFDLVEEKKRQIEVNNSKVLLDFVTQYGLFGVIAKDGGDVFKWPAISNTEVNSIWFPRLKSDYPNPIQSKTEKERFWQEYAEPLSSLGDIMAFYYQIDTWNQYFNCGASPNDHIHPGLNNQRWRDVLETDYAYPIGLGLVYDGSWQLSWYFESLLQALMIMWLNDVTSSQQRVKICEYCDRAFVARSPKARYCPKTNGFPSTCGVNARVNRHREKKKANQE